MGTLRGDNGGERPPEGDGVPDLPPEWGLVVIPDDASELDDEATALRREWRRTARIDRWRQRLGLAPGKNAVDGLGSSAAGGLGSSAADGLGGSAVEGAGSSLALPMLIMAIAIVATVTSLFALVWPDHPVRRAVNAEPSAATSTATLADLTLLDSSATPVRLRDHLPAVILLVDECDCGSLISATAAAAPSNVTVLAIGHAAPPLPGPGAGDGAGSTASRAPPGRGPTAPDSPSATQKQHAGPALARIRALADPAGLLMATFHGERPPAGQAVAILVGRGGQILSTVTVSGVDQILSQLPRLG